MRHGHPDAEVKLRRLTALLEDSPDATIAVDARGRIEEWNPAAEALLGWSRAEILHTPIRRCVPTDGMATYEAAWNQLAAGTRVPNFDAERLHRDGHRVPVNVHTTAVLDDDGFAGTVATLREQPHSDTAAPDARRLNVPSRRALQTALAAPLAAGTVRAVALLDVDAFALVNQTYGPDVGDQVLLEVSRRLDACNDGAVTGRWQADEFVYVLDGPGARQDLEALIARALVAMRVPVPVGDQTLFLTVSAGLASSTVTPGPDLFAAATHALEVAKAGGRDRAVWLDAAQRRPIAGLRLANDLRVGIETGQLRLLYQPIVELANHDVVGVEALVRWERPGFGLLSPSEFIDAAERTGQIVSLGAWVSAQACQTAVRLAQLASAPHSMSINLSARQLMDPGVVGMLQCALADTGCDPASVIIEVTETALMQDMARATATLQAMKALGVALALDDFGTGYSSLLYLKNFPVDRIKIDQSFIGGLGVDADDTAIVASTISLAHSVGVQAVAEGVETVDQLTLLRQMGCDFAQGFLFSAPLTLAELQRWLAAHPAARRRRVRDAPRTTVAPEASRILRLHREGASLHTIAAALNVDGLHTAVGVRWSPKSVANVIATAQFPGLALPR
jgi:PAS domain S-box-containing protein/diguanylate cyclase (GGDEF)-like protein